MAELSSLKNFNWHGIDKDGKRRRGKIIAFDEQEAKFELTALCIFILKIEPKKFSAFHYLSKRISSQIIIDFTRQLLTLLRANLNLAVALQFIAKSQDHLYFRAIVRQIQQDVDAGFSLQQALLKHPSYFSEFYCQLIYVGEQSSSLAIILQEILSYLEKSAHLQSKIKQALFYPIIVLIVTSLVIYALLFFVVPQFQLMYDNFGASLPYYTQAVIDFSEWLSRRGWILAGVFSLFIVILWCYQRTTRGAYQLDYYSIKLPLIGVLNRYAIISRLVRTLATALQAGLPIVEALHIMTNSTGNRVFQRALAQMREQIIAGQSLTQAMTQTQLFPERVLQMLMIATETGSLTSMLMQIAEYYETQVEWQVERLTRLLEPLLMLIIGGLVGSLIIAMYLPIFRLGNVI